MLLHLSHVTFGVWGAKFQFVFSWNTADLVWFTKYLVFPRMTFAVQSISHLETLSLYNLFGNHSHTHLWHIFYDQRFYFHSYFYIKISEFMIFSVTLRIWYFLCQRVAVFSTVALLRFYAEKFFVIGDVLALYRMVKSTPSLYVWGSSNNKLLFPCYENQICL